MQLLFSSSHTIIRKPKDILLSVIVINNTVHFPVRHFLSVLYDSQLVNTEHLFGFLSVLCLRLE